MIAFKCVLSKFVLYDCCCIRLVLGVIEGKVKEIKLAALYIDS